MKSCSPFDILLSTYALCSQVFSQRLQEFQGHRYLLLALCAYGTLAAQIDGIVAMRLVGGWRAAFNTLKAHVPAQFSSHPSVLLRLQVGPGRSSICEELSELLELATEYRV